MIWASLINQRPIIRILSSEVSSIEFGSKPKNKTKIPGFLSFNQISEFKYLQIYIYRNFLLFLDVDFVWITMNTQHRDCQLCWYILHKSVQLEKTDINQLSNLEKKNITPESSNPKSCFPNWYDLHNFLCCSTVPKTKWVSQHIY